MPSKVVKHFWYDKEIYKILTVTIITIIID